MSITKLECMELKDTRYSVYPYDGYNLEEILGKFYEAIKECNDLSFSLQEFNTWLIDTGLLEEVEKQLSKVDWDKIVNSELYQTVVERLLNTNNRIEAVAERLLNTNNRIEEVKNELSSQLDTNIHQNFNEFNGVNSQLGMCINTTPIDETLISKLKTDGIKYIRMSIYWYGVETTKGVYNFSKADNEINLILNNGMIPQIILFGGNTLYGENELSVISEAGLAGWSNFVTNVVDRYKNKGVQWEIWNEPWNSSFWSPFTVTSGKYYANLVKRTYPIIKNIDKTATVVGTSMINFDLRLTDWYELACKYDLLKYLDKVSLHYYSLETTYPEKDIQGFYDKIRFINRKYIDYDIPLTVTETGYTTAPSSTQTVTEANRSKYIPRVLLLNLINGVDGTSIYEAKSKQTPNTDREQWFGLLKIDNTPTTTYTNLIKLISELTNYAYVDRIKSNSDDYILKFVDDNNNFKYVAWTISDPHTVIVDGLEILLSNDVSYVSSIEKLSLRKKQVEIENNSILRKINEFINLSKKYNEILQTTKCDFLFNTSTEPWSPTSIAGGVVGTSVSPNHPGIHTYLCHASNANSGFLYRLGANTFILSGGEKSTIVFKTPSDFSNIIRRSGFFYSANITEPTNGVYLQQEGSTIVGKTSNNGVRTTTVSSFTMNSNTWYRGVIEVGDNAKVIYFNLYDDVGNELWGDIITTTIPGINSGGNPVGHEDICVATSSTGERVIGSIDYMDVYIPNARKLV